MKIEITSPIGGASYDEATYVSLWAAEGQIGVLPGHADLIAAVQPGPVRIALPGGDVNGVCGSGFIRIEDGAIHLAAEQWTDDPEAIDVDQRRTEIQTTLEESPGQATIEKLKREQTFLAACQA